MKYSYLNKARFFENCIDKNKYCAINLYSISRYSVYIFIILCVINPAQSSPGLPDNTDKKVFNFFVNSDPQMGAQFTHIGSVAVLNNLLRDFTIETNAIPEPLQPDFVVFNGDLVWKPDPDKFANFKRLTESLTPKTVLVHGNHDGVFPDTQFLDLQEGLSGYRNLHYSFNYGDWHFVVMAAPQQYPTTQSRDEMMNWLDNDLSTNSGKNTLLFMHYAIMPVGLSQMEYYTYSPISFKNRLLDIITNNNVNYVVSGHIHSGIKGSVKTLSQYKNTKFIIAPTPVYSRMFGEEYPNMSGSGSYYRHGYFTEFKIDHNELSIVGRKIGSNQFINYPDTYKEITKNDEIRSYVKEGDLKEDFIFQSSFSNIIEQNKLFNGSFNQGLEGWSSSYRYISDDQQNFINRVENGTNILKINSKWGGWNKEEYIENYQIFKYKPNMFLNANFLYPIQVRTAGAYIKLAGYDVDNNLNSLVLLHWGTNEDTVHIVPQCWGYHWRGEVTSITIVNELINANNAISFKLPVQNNIEQNISVSIDNIVSELNNNQLIDHFSLSYGVWTKYDEAGTPYKAEIRMNEIDLSDKGFDSTNPIKFNDNYILMSEKEAIVDYGLSHR